jgi:dTDP-4-dehydrorhamnose reductase
MGDVDKCEVDKKSCEMQNYHFVEVLYKHLKNNNFKKLIHFSTNAVYDGDHAPYGENSNCFPVNFYGLVKLKADNFLLNQKDPRVMVVRPITMYGRAPSDGRANPVSMIIKKLQGGQNLKLVSDVLVNILYVEDLVRAIEKLITVDFTGLINISANKVYSRYDLGLEIAKLIGAKKDLIESVTSTEFETVADRPLDTSFDNALMREIGIHTRTLEQTIHSLL